MENFFGVVVSGAYVVAVLVVANVAARRGASEEATRKLVHIALGGWWVIASFFFTSTLWAAALPVLFIGVNAYAYRKRSLSFMARDEEHDTPGTVYYACSLAVLALFSFAIDAPYIGALGVFCMAFGDGFAAVFGARYGRHVVRVAGGNKTVVGCAVMFAVSFVVCALVLAAPAPLGAGGLGAPFAESSVASGKEMMPTLALFTALSPIAAVVVATFVLALAATVLEMFSDRGLDNLTVPLGVSALYVVFALPPMWFTPLLSGALLSGVVALLSLRLQLLTLPAAWGAVVVGACLFFAGGWPLWLLLMWFFGSSNIASKVMAQRARGQAQSRKHTKPRGLWQVLANSVPCLACALGYVASGEMWFLVVAAGALAASTADTWASEVGIYSKNPPVNILTRKPMQRGLSGGVSPLGLAATAVASVLCALLALVLFAAFGFSLPANVAAFVCISVCGVAGSLVDSVLGARVQAKYRIVHGSDRQQEASVANQKVAAVPLVESVPAGDVAYQLASGYAWVTNDIVNFMSGVAAVLLGLIIAL